MPYLSFNENVNSDMGKKVDSGDAAQEPAKLAYTWSFWEQPAKEDAKYEEMTNKVCDFSTVQDFFKLFNRVPQPSSLLESRPMREQPDGKTHGIDAISIFREGIRPEWEDKLNATGGHFQFQLKPEIGAGQLDEYWNNLVLGVIGSTIVPVSMITGIRLVDKLSRGGVLRIEVWYHTRDDTQAVSALKQNVEKCMSKRFDGSAGKVPPCAQKSHGRP